jgi:cytosine/adenosine deaminase-related metal-dependent hydrolase
LLVGATIEDGSIVDVRLEGDRIAAVGQLERLPTDEVHDLAGYLLLPAPAEPP